MLQLKTYLTQKLTFFSYIFFGGGRKALHFSLMTLIWMMNLKNSNQLSSQIMERISAMPQNKGRAVLLLWMNYLGLTEGGLGISGRVAVFIVI